MKPDLQTSDAEKRSKAASSTISAECECQNTEGNRAYTSEKRGVQVNIFTMSIGRPCSGTDFLEALT